VGTTVRGTTTVAAEPCPDFRSSRSSIFERPLRTGVRTPSQPTAAAGALVASRASERPQAGTRIEAQNALRPPQFDRASPHGSIRRRPQERMFRSDASARTRAARRFCRADAGAGIGARRLDIRRSARTGARAAPTETTGIERSGREARPPRSYRNLITGAVVPLVLSRRRLLLWQWPNNGRGSTASLPRGRRSRRPRYAACEHEAEDHDRIEPGTSRAPATPAPGAAAGAARRRRKWCSMKRISRSKRQALRESRVAPGPSAGPGTAPSLHPCRIRVVPEASWRDLIVPPQHPTRGLPRQPYGRNYCSTAGDFPGAGISQRSGIRIEAAEK